MHEWSEEEAAWYKATNGRFLSPRPLDRTGKIGALLALGLVVVQIAVAVIILIP